LLVAATDSTSETNPRAEYANRLASRQRTLARAGQREALLGNARVLVFILAVVVAWFVFYQRSLSPWWLAPVLLLFVILLLWHDRVNRALARARRAVELYERGLARLDDAWAGTGEAGLRFSDPDHPYAADLDLFGCGSLFERLCRARTRDGENTLAEWLLAPTSLEDILERQEAVRELRPRLDLLEDLDMPGATLRSVADPEGLVRWGLAPRILRTDWGATAVEFLPMIVLTGLVLWIITGYGRVLFFGGMALEVALSIWLRAQVNKVVGAIERKARDLALLATVLARLEREECHSDRLVRLREMLVAGEHSASRRIGELSRLVDRLEWRHNQLFAPLAAVLLWTSRHAYAFESWRAASGRLIGPWLKAVGEFEALLALASYSYENPTDPFPAIEPAGMTFDADELAHPLIPRSRSVSNSLRLDQDLRLLVVSGSNMSGKSTLLRSVGVNAVLALAGAPVRARSLRLCPVAIGATLRIQDSLQAGHSRFYAEIRRVRELMSLAAGPLPLLFLLDELFQGTNSHDRRLGAQAVVSRLVQSAAIGLITTHDLALTQIGDHLAPRAANVHFEDQFQDGRMTFDYRLRAGVVPRSNALALMRAVGLDVPDSPDSPLPPGEGMGVRGQL
jgi:hypothetical protein